MPISIAGYPVSLCDFCFMEAEASGHTIQQKTWGGGEKTNKQGEFLTRDNGVILALTL